MYIEGHIECRHGDAPPHTEVNTPIVVAHEPTQVHTQALARRTLIYRREVLLAVGIVLRSEEVAPEIREDGAQVAMLLIARLEVVTNTTPLGDYMAQATHKILKINAIKCAVDIGAQVLHIGLRSVTHKVLGGVIHISHHAVGTLHYGTAVTPRDGGSKEARNLPIYGARKTVRHTDGVCLDKTLVIISIVQSLKEFAHLLAAHIRECCHRSLRFFGRSARRASRRV